MPVHHCSGSSLSARAIMISACNTKEHVPKKENTKKNSNMRNFGVDMSNTDARFTKLNMGSSITAPAHFTRLKMPMTMTDSSEQNFGVDTPNVDAIFTKLKMGLNNTASTYFTKFYLDEKQNHMTAHNVEIEAVPITWKRRNFDHR